MKVKCINCGTIFDVPIEPSYDGDSTLQGTYQVLHIWARCPVCGYENKVAIQ